MCKEFNIMRSHLSDVLSINARNHTERTISANKRKITNFDEPFFFLYALQSAHLRKECELFFS